MKEWLEDKAVMLYISLVSGGIGWFLYTCFKYKSWEDDD